MEGLNHTLSTHAAGVIIMNTDIRDVMPVYTAAKGDAVQSMYPMKWAEDQGAVKFDFLGLLNLTIIGEALRLIDAGRDPGDALDIDGLPLDDKATYAIDFDVASFQVVKPQQHRDRHRPSFVDHCGNGSAHRDG